MKNKNAYIVGGFLFISVLIFIMALSLPKTGCAETQINVIVTASGTPPVKIQPIITVPPTTPTRYNFVRNIEKGSFGADVLALQRLLNQDPDTKITETGAGSPGNETSYFGEMTKQAVIRFQNKYAVVVLHPYGLKEGTGFVGPATRGMLNKL